MSRYLSRKYAALTPYTPGEQPQDQQYVKLNTNESPFPPSPFAERLARQAAGDLQLYSDPTCHALVQTAAECFRLAEEEILFTNGSDEILNFAMMAFCDETCPAVFPNVTYGFYPVIAGLNGVPCREIPLSADFTLCVEDYIGVDGTIFLANPNAPTGIALSAREVERIVAGNPDHIVVVDEAYVDFGAESVLPLIHKYDNLLVCQTFSKSRSMAGARLGFGAACAAIIRDLTAVKDACNPYNINRMTMAAGIGALADASYFEENCRRIEATRARVKKELAMLGFTMTDSSANFVFAKHPKLGGQELYLALKAKGVLVRHFETPLLRDYNRITIGSDAQMDALLGALREIEEERL